MLIIGLFTSYETSGGIREDVHGEQKEINGERGTVISGMYSYMGTDGLLYTVTYTADENGFRPEGAHFPKEVQPLPVPPVVLPIAPAPIVPAPIAPAPIATDPIPTPTIAEMPELPRP